MHCGYKPVTKTTLRYLKTAVCILPFKRQLILTCKANYYSTEVNYRNRDQQKLFYGKLSEVMSGSDKIHHI